eukprot:1446847-Rhodomonas_salina.1
MNTHSNNKLTPEQTQHTWQHFALECARLGFWRSDGLAGAGGGDEGGGGEASGGKGQGAS